MIPPRSVLAAIDFSEPSRAALALAARLARQSTAGLHILHAEDPLLAAAAQVRGFDLRRDTCAELEAFVQATPEASQPVGVHVVTGRAADVICDIARRERADVVVVGARGLGAAEHALFGSTTENVLRNADVSVLVVPDRWIPPRPDTLDLTGIGPLVAGVDFAEPSLSAAAAAARLAATLGTSLEIVHVVSPVPALARWATHADAAIASQLAAAGKEMESAVRLVNARVPVRTRIETGTVAEQLAAAASPGAGRQPILVLGRRTRADRHGAPGATAYRVLTRMRVPVLVIVPDISRT